MQIRFIKGWNGTTPVRSSKTAAAYDAFAAEDVLLRSGDIRRVSLDLKVEIPADYHMLICPRSGKALSGLTVANAPGIVDSDYRGDVAVLLKWNPPDGVSSLEVKKGDRIAQLLFQKTIEVEFVEVQNLSSTERGEGGFGSTGR